MAEIHVHAEGLVHAPTDFVYSLVRNYRDHHWRFLPPAFSAWEVEEGGIGEGTIVRFKGKMGGITRSFRSAITEPEPGRVLVETDTFSSLVTTFTFTPQEENCLVRFDTVWNSSSGIVGLLERTFAPRQIRPMYLDELSRLDRYAQEQWRQQR